MKLMCPQQTLLSFNILQAALRNPKESWSLTATCLITCRASYTNSKLTPAPSSSLGCHSEFNLSCILFCHVNNVNNVFRYHDMGLIGSYLGVLYCGGSGFYLSPFAFLKNPLVWLTCASKYKATHMQAPNFAYALASRRFNALKKPLDPPLDLSCVR